MRLLCAAACASPPPSPPFFHRATIPLPPPRLTPRAVSSLFIPKAGSDGPAVRTLEGEELADQKAALAKLAEVRAFEPCTSAASPEVPRLSFGLATGPEPRQPSTAFPAAAPD